MSKSVLIIDTPNKCEECILCKKMEDGCHYCMATNKIIVDKTLKKILLCPLITEEELIYNSEIYKEVTSIEYVAKHYDADAIMEAQINR